MAVWGWGCVWGGGDADGGPRQPERPFDPPLFTAVTATCSVTGPPILSRGNGVAAAGFSNGQDQLRPWLMEAPVGRGALEPAAHLLKSFRLGLTG